MSNEITAYFKGTTGVAESVYQHDYGMIMNIDGLTLSDTFDVHFEISGSASTVTAIGSNNRVAIPNDCLAVPGKLTAYIYTHTGSHDGETAYVVTFQVINRARPDDDITDATEENNAKAIVRLQTEHEEDVSKINNNLDAIENNIDDVEAAATALTARVATAESDIDSLEAQFTTVVSAVTTDTEVTNIRVGDDGVTYSTAGEAVRNQFSNIKDCESSLSYLLQTNGHYSFSLVSGEYIRKTDGSFQPDDSWSRTGLLPCGGIEKIYVKRPTSSEYNAWYDRKGAFISIFRITASDTGFEISVPSNAFYFAISESTASMEAIEIWTDGLKAINDMEESLSEEISIVDDKASVGFASGIGTFGVLTQEGKYNLDIVKDEYVNKADGAFLPHVGWDRTEKTICKGATHIYVKKSTSSDYNAWYDKNGDFISTFQNVASTIGFEVEVPSTAWYFAISDTASVIANLEVTIKVSAIEKLKEEIDLIHESVPGVGAQLSYLTDYFPPLIDAVLSHQSGESVSMVFITDSHHMQLDNQIDAVSSIEYIIERVGINAVIIGGDDVYDSANESVRPTIDQWFMDYMNEAYRLRSVILPVIGNHDDLTWRISNYDGTWIDEPWSDLRPWYYTPTQLYRMNSKRSNWTIVRDPENPTGNYYYYDIPHTDIRVLCLNTSDTPTDLTITKTLNNQETIVYKYVGNTLAIGTKQVEFVENMLRGFNGTLIVCSHSNLNDISEHGCPKPINADAITGMLKAWKNGTSFSYTGSNADIPCSVNVSFAESHTLIGCFNGHTHYDTLRTIDGITYVSILNSQCGAYSDSPARTDGTYTKIAYDVITVVPEESKVYLTRFGAGDSREFTY